MMQAAVFRSRPSRPVMACRTSDPCESDSTNRISAVRELLEEIKVREPNRSEVVQVIAAAADGALNQAACGRVADAILALWKR